ncbi:hypothetical protein M8J76_012391 [Diaphorina citri]|nr:hypothetical protein M8J76_012391 [Diaphorina citri]
MTSPEDDKMDDRNKMDPVPNNSSYDKDLWAKYKKVRKTGRVENPSAAAYISQRNTQNILGADYLEQAHGSNQRNSIENIARIRSDKEIRSNDSLVSTNGTVSKDINGNCDTVTRDLDKHSTILNKGANTHSDADMKDVALGSTVPNNDVNQYDPREKKNSISVSIHEEIRKSFSRTRSLSVTVIKNIFKKSKTFHNSSDTLISSRSTKPADAVIPNFIFKYHTEDVDDPLPQSAKVGWFRQCCTAFSMGLNTLVCGILLGLMSSNDSIMMTLQFSSHATQRDLLLIWLKYAFLIGSFNLLHFILRRMMLRMLANQ